MSTREIMTVAEASEYLKVHVKTLHEWIKAGDLPVVKLGPRSTRVRKIDIDKFLSSRLSGPVAGPVLSDVKASASSTVTRAVKSRIVR